MLRGFVRALAVSLALATQPALAQGTDVGRLWSLTPAPNPRLGLAFPGKDPSLYGRIAGMGIGVVRIGVGWKWLEPEAGEYRFKSLDAQIAALDAAGLVPFVTLEADAPWAVDHGDRVKNGTPRDLADWSALVTRLVERYDMDGTEDGPALSRPVRFWQVANEPLSDANKSGGWAGSDADLVAFVNAAHDAAKAAHPSVTFVLGGIASMNLDAFLVTRQGADMPVQQVWQNGTKTVLSTDDADMMASLDAAYDRLETLLSEGRYDLADAHLYGPEDRDPARLALIGELAGTPALSSECGGPSLDYGGTYSGQEHYRAVLWRNLNVLASGAPFCLWFGLGEGLGSTFGNSRVQLLDPQLDDKPGTHAYRLLSTILDEKATVTRLAPALFEVQTEAGPVRIALTEAGIRALADLGPLMQPALCIRDAETQETDAIVSAAPCDGYAILLSGPGLSRVF
ncbi:beta-galactosidase [Maritimibacter sp. DP1N21-5]|uniref:beta-galactosidase n=1 Tax=Maritimibacter sp. DP1N21-5 TaxID=2836867 RepID=UPI001C445FCC|nr:beta-galactosidase [Maritimibacter sp. DP1N21-5]MBV7410679.1 beta-galactosidase [Maritimibacter sp. DP1N21-5]